ncbi:MAG: hypothetical protein QM820_09860 [Minicystis sp.]
MMIRIVACGSAVLFALTMAVACGGGGNVNAVAKSCPDGWDADPEVAEAFSGSNGTFEDACDENGNLIQYGCGSKEVWTCSDWECYDEPETTDEVVSRTIDCAGTCQNGACPSLCPKDNTSIVFESLDGTAHGIIREVGTENRWDCDAISISSITPEGLGEYLDAPSLTVDRSAWGPGQLCLKATPGHFMIKGPTLVAPTHWTCFRL